MFYALTALFTAVKAVAGALETLQRDGTPAAAAGGMISYAAFCDLVDLARHQDLDDRFGA